jgi:hypothetical protein
MAEAINFSRALEVWVYVFVGLVSLYFIRKFILAWQELRGAGFGLERERAQSRLNQSAIILVLLIFMAVAEFVLVSFVAPSLPSANALSTPTLSLLATATTTTGPGIAETPGSGIPTAIVGQAKPTEPSGCVPGQIEITSPKDGQEISGVVQVLGTAAIQNFGFYKIETKLPDDPSWSTLQAGNIIVQQGKLSDWDTSRLSPGEYLIGLALVDNQARLTPPCVVKVRVVPPPNATAGP